MTDEYSNAMYNYNDKIKKCGIDIGRTILGELGKRNEGKAHVFTFDMLSLDSCKLIGSKVVSEKFNYLGTVAENYVAWTTFDCSHVRVYIDSVKPTVKYVIERETKL